MLWCWLVWFCIVFSYDCRLLWVLAGVCLMNCWICIMVVVGLCFSSVLMMWVLLLVWLGLSVMMWWVIVLVLFMFLVMLCRCMCVFSVGRCIGIVCS